MRTEHTFSTTSGPNWVVRICAFLMGAWLFVTPQVMFSTAVMDLCEEAGGTLLPLIEEELAKHVGTQPPCSIRAMGSMASWDSDLPNVDDRPLGSLHGEVPHLPPWC